MNIKSLFSLPNLVGCVYLFLGLKSTSFLQNSLLSGYDQSAASLFATPLPSVILFMFLAFFSFKKKRFPLHLLAAYLWIFYVAVTCFLMVSVLMNLDGGAVLTVMEKMKAIGGTLLVCAPVFIYSWCLYCYEKRGRLLLKAIN